MRVARWVLWSRKRLCVAAGAAFVGMVVVSTLMGALAPTPTPGPEDTTGLTASEVAGGESQTAQRLAASPETDAARAAGEFMAAWLDADPDKETWISGLREHSTPELATSMYLVDQSLIPAGPVRSMDLETVTDESALVRVELPKKQGELYVSLVPTDDGWKASALTEGHEGHAE